MNKLKKKVASPGEFLSTEEEFIPGKNTFEENGEIFSGSTGLVVEDLKSKEISVKPASEPVKIRPGSVVFGRVDVVKDSSVLIEMQNVYGSNKKVFTSSFAVLPVRNVSRDYVERLRDFFKVGDLVKAKVAKILPGNNIDLETSSSPDFGVIKAFCSRCRKPLYLFGSSLKCTSCGNTEGRKISNDYLLK